MRESCMFQFCISFKQLHFYEKISSFVESAERRCSSEGQWESRLGEPDPIGWTNFTPCFRPEVNILLKKIYAGGDDDGGKVTLN